MRRQNDISPEAFDLLADLIGGQSMVLTNTSPAARKMAYVVDGNVIDNDVVRELFDLCAGAVWPLFAEGFIEKDHSDDEAEEFIRSFGGLCGRYVGAYVLTDAGRAYVAKRFPQKAA